MSNWTYVHGVISVDAFGRTQAEKRYILETVVQHLPKVTGSEEDMYTHIVQYAGYNESCSHNEFGIWEGSIEMQSNYGIVVEGHFRDREFNQTLREFMKWFFRLCKRVQVDRCIVQVCDEYGHSVVIAPKQEVLHDLFEWYSWSRRNGTANWTEYLIWREITDEQGNRYVGKPDFPDGSCIDDMTEEELKRWRLRR